MCIFKGEMYLHCIYKRVVRNRCVVTVAWMCNKIVHPCEERGHQNSQQNELLVAVLYRFRMISSEEIYIMKADMH